MVFSLYMACCFEMKMTYVEHNGKTCVIGYLYVRSFLKLVILTILYEW